MQGSAQIPKALNQKRDVRQQATGRSAVFRENLEQNQPTRVKRFARAKERRVFHITAKSFPDSDAIAQAQQNSSVAAIFRYQEPDQSELSACAHAIRATNLRPFSTYSNPSTLTYTISPLYSNTYEVVERV